MVAEKKSIAPYKAIEIPIQKDALDLVELLKIDVNDEYDANLIERFRGESNLEFVANETRYEHFYRFCRLFICGTGNARLNMRTTKNDTRMNNR